MAETYGFYDTEELVDGSYDREYVAQQWADYFKLFIGTGVFASPTNQLKVVAGEGMNIIVKEGWAFIEGRWYHNDADLVIPVQPNTTVSTITSGVFIQADSSDRVIKAVIATGRTTPDREAPFYELELAQIQIATGTTAITDAMITDMRTDESVCGFVKGLLEGVIPTADLFLQFETQFMDWFDRMKDQLSEDAAGNLQLQIDALHADIGLDYDSYEEAMDDIANIPEGARVFTPEPDETIQDIINDMTAIHLAGSQVGSGTKNFTFNTEAYKRMLIITKKSGVLVGSKEIPTDVLDTNDVIPLGNAVPLIGTDNIPNNYTLDTNLKDKKLAGYYTSSSTATQLFGFNEQGISTPTNQRAIGLASDLSKTTDASLTYNGNNSFTISVTDSSLSVYVYVDMLVLGGSASGRNVSVNLAGTDLVSTDAEGAILEVYEKVRKVGMRPVDTTRRIMLATPNASYTADVDCVVAGHYRAQNNGNSMMLYVDDVDVYGFWDGAAGSFGMQGAYYPIAKGQTIKFTGNAQIQTGTLGLYHYVE